MRSVHVVINTFGSLGDLFPFLAVGQALLWRGHRVTVATHAMHQGPVEQAGLHFANASGMPEPDDRSAFVARAFHPTKGPGFLVHDLAAMDVRDSYTMMQLICRDADVLVTSSLAFAGQILGETLSAAGRLHWVSAILAPCSFISAYEAPMVGIPLLDALSRNAPRRVRIMRKLLEWRTRPWTAPVRTLRRELGLRAVSAGGDPFHRGQHSPDCVLALFSPLLGQPQPDWPPHVRVTGFAHYAQPGAHLDDALQAFLRNGTPPLVFSLGSTAVHIGADFLRESLKVCEQLNRRGLLFTGSPEMRATLPARLPPTLLAVDYAPHALVFPHAAAIVHHGGIGTSSEALRAGRPMLVVPHGFDQFDNGERLKKLGIAHTLPSRHYDATTATALLRDLLENPSFAQNAKLYADMVRQEHGAKVAVNLIESNLSERF